MLEALIYASREIEAKWSKRLLSDRLQCTNSQGNEEYQITCVCSGVAFKVKGVIEAFATESAEVTLDIWVALHMAIEKSLEAERLWAHAAHELAAAALFLHHN